jgi:hypothetical protein
VDRHPNVIYVLRGLRSRPLLFALECCEGEVVDGVAVESGLVSVDYRILTVCTFVPTHPSTNPVDQPIDLFVKTCYLTGRRG